MHNAEYSPATCSRVIGIFCLDMVLKLIPLIKQNVCDYSKYDKIVES